MWSNLDFWGAHWIIGGIVTKTECFFIVHLLKMNPLLTNSKFG